MKLVGDGFVLLVLGLSVVFLFIFIMVGFINVTAAILRRFETAQPVVEGAPVDVDDETEIAAAAAAVQAFRAKS
jgi:sodium pump decarboxylase gamma subunit